MPIRSLSAAQAVQPPRANRPPDALHLVVPTVRQSKNYTCGAASSVAVLRAFGQEATERGLAKEMKSDPTQGTLPAHIVKAMKARGLGAEAQTDLTFGKLREHLQRGALVIVAYQAWRDDVKTPWAQLWDDGHYSVVTGMDEANVYLMDPSQSDRGFVPRQEFEERWHDVDGHGTKLRSFGIIVDGVRAAAGPKPATVSLVECRGR